MPEMECEQGGFSLLRLYDLALVACSFPNAHVYIPCHRDVAHIRPGIEEGLEI